MNHYGRPESSVQQPDTMQRSPIEWAELGCEAIMKTYAPEQLPPDRFHYHQGVFLSGMEKCWQITQKPAYYDYIKGWVDYNIRPDGSIRAYNPAELDDLQPGVLLFNLLKQTGDERYKKALDELISRLEAWKTNPSGGFWHKDRYPNQMWLDGLYMYGPLAALYAKAFGKDQLFDRIAAQAILLEQHTRDPVTGLLYHGWDETRSAVWADSETGLAPEFWGRSIGWVPVALLEMLEHFPTEHKDRPALISMLQNLLEAVVKYQDSATGRWYQVIDKGHLADNWLENSCTCLFVHAIAKAARMGLLRSEYLQYARKGYQGVIDTLHFDEDGLLVIDQICIGTGIGNYTHYIARPTRQNDLHGVGAFVLMCVEMAAIEKDPGASQA